VIERDLGMTEFSKLATTFAIDPEVNIGWPGNVGVSVEGDVAFYDTTINATRVLSGKCRRDPFCQFADYVAPGKLLRLGNGFAVTLETNCSGAAGAGLCVAKRNISGATALASLPTATLPASVAVKGDTVAFATEDASTFEGFSIFVRSAAGEQQQLPYEGPGGAVRQLVLIGDDMLAALVGDQVSIFTRSTGGAFKQAQVIGDNTVIISEIRASDTKLAVAFLRTRNATLDLYYKSTVDAKWTLEKTFTNGWPAYSPFPSSQIMFDLDGDRLVYFTRKGEGLLMSYPDVCPRRRLSKAEVGGIVAGTVVLLVLIAVLMVKKIKWSTAVKTRKTGKTAEEHRIQPTDGY
jgi:hypothetical protein